MHEIKGEIDLSQVGNTAPVEVTNIPQPTEVNGQPHVELPKDFKASPELMRKIARIIKNSQPKHENYRLCHKKCKGFKCNHCWVLAADAQKACWDSWHDDKGVATGPQPTVDNAVPAEVATDAVEPAKAEQPQ